LPPTGGQRKEVAAMVVVRKEKKGGRGDAPGEMGWGGELGALFVGGDNAGVRLMAGAGNHGR